MKGLSRSLALPLSSILICIVAVVGCSTVGFYTQAVGGQLHLITHRVAVSELIDSSATPDELRARLERIEAILAFAEDRLALPVGDRYRSYVDVDKPFLVWNVVAAPEFETAPLNRCYPIIGCAAYRGYFNEKGALKEAERLRDRGFDVHVGGAAAYSTLGWFDDPIVSTFADWRTERLAELLFHELAHSVVYLKNDTAFNEAFASFVGEQGVGMWLGPNGLPGFERAQRDEKQLFALLAGWRERLDTIYAEDIPMAEKRRRKEASFEALRACYAMHRDRMGGGRFDEYMARPFNNARLATISTYQRYVPAFARLFRVAGGDWATFYASVVELGRDAARGEKLAELLQEEIAHRGYDEGADQVEC